MGNGKVDVKSIDRSVDFQYIAQVVQMPSSKMEEYMESQLEKLKDLSEKDVQSLKRKYYKTKASLANNISSSKEMHSELKKIPKDYLNIMESEFNPTWVNVVKLCNYMTKAQVTGKQFRFVAMLLIIAAAIIIFAFKGANNTDIIYNAETDTVSGITTNIVMDPSDEELVYSDYALDMSDASIIKAKILAETGGPSVSFVALNDVDTSSGILSSKEKDIDEAINSTVDDLLYDGYVKKSAAILIYIKSIDEYRLMVNSDYNSKYNYVYSSASSDKSTMSGYSAVIEMQTLSQLVNNDIRADSVGETYCNLVDYIHENIDMQAIAQDHINNSITSNKFMIVMFALMFGTPVVLVTAFCYCESAYANRKLSHKSYIYAVKLVNIFDSCMAYELLEQSKEKTEYSNDKEDNTETSKEDEHSIDLNKYLEQLRKACIMLFDATDIDSKLKCKTLNSLLEIQRLLESSDTHDTATRELERFFRKYWDTVSVILSKLNDLDDDDKKEQSERFIKYLYTIIHSICDKSNNEKSLNVDVELDTMDYMMKLDGYNSDD